MRIARIVSQLATGVFSRKLIRSGRQVGSICTDDCIGGDSRREIQWDDGFDLAVRLEGNQVVVSSPPPSFTPNNHAGSDDATYVRPIAERSVLIVAEAQTVERVVNEGSFARFTVTNTGDVSTTYSLSASCTGFSSCATPFPSSLALPPGQSGTTIVTYTTPATAGAQSYGNGTFPAPQTSR